MTGQAVPVAPVAPLADRVRALLEQALELYQDSPRATGWLRRHLARFDEPLRLAVVGPRGSGKSTLVNALAGEEVAPLPVAGSPLGWFRAAPEPRAVAYPRGAPPAELGLTRGTKELRIDPAGLAGLADVERVELAWPNRSLRELTLLDTPALDDEESVAAVEGVGTEADAVLFLLPQPEHADLRFLRMTMAHPIARVAPVHALGVLCRADELGGGRVDGLISARQVARRHRRQAEVGLLCQDVVAVAGLLACAGRTLRDAEFAALTELAMLPKAELDPHLLSADRFAGQDVPVEQATRAGLLARLGLFGVRLATTLIRTGATTKAELATALAQRSGLGDLRDAIATYLTGHRPVLKARAALLALEVVLRLEPRSGTTAVAAELERVVAGAHEFRELRALAALRGGRVALPDELRAEAARLLGADGTDVRARLGLDPDADEGRRRHAAFEALWRWREQTENETLPAAARATAALLARTCESLTL